MRNLCVEKEIGACHCLSKRLSENLKEKKVPRRKYREESTEKKVSRRKYREESVEKKVSRRKYREKVYETFAL